MKQVCFPNRHMRPEEYALWDVSRKLAHQTGVLYFDGREMAKLFKSTAKDRIYRAAKGLIKMGWFEVIAAAARDKRTGLYSCTQYRVLSAEEWLATHPHTCVSSLETGTGASPQNATGNQSSKRERPVPITRMTSPQNATYSDKENLDKEIVRESPVLKTRLDETATASLSRDSFEADYGKFRQEFREWTGMAALDNGKMRTRYAELATKYGQDEVCNAIPLWVRRDDRTDNKQWAAYNFLFDLAEHIIEERRDELQQRPGRGHIQSTYRPARRPDGTCDGELPQLVIPER
jgi:hypothetical protein